MSSNKGLGRGLDALFGGSAPKQEPQGQESAVNLVPVSSLRPNPNQPRRHFDEAALRELADSIKSQGIIQPLLVRPHGGENTYQIVAGERRWRACQLAGVAEIPAMIRELTDEQALEVQVVENLQREDVTELEEAEGYEVLMQHGNLSAEQVGAKIGKSRSYVYGRLKVLDLCQQGREALREGQLDFSKALLIARIPDEGLQIKALEFCTHTNWEGDLPGYRECARHIQDEFMLRLDKAQFTITDATLLPEAGACGDCPKRTGANPDLFKDVDSADVCTDPKCYRAKEDAHTAQVVAAAQAKLYSEATKPSEQIAAQQLAKSIAGRKAYIPPFFPGKRMVVTTLDNLHCYTQRGTRKRKADDNQDRKCFDNQYWRMEGYALGEHLAYGGFEEADIEIGAAPAAPEA